MSVGIRTAHVSAVLQRLSRKSDLPRVVGIHSTAPWRGSDRVQVESTLFDVAACRSELEIRERMAERGQQDPPLVIITSLADTELAEDVLARLARQRLHHIDHWQTVRELFRAHDLDPRLGRLGWVAAALVDAAESGPLPPAPGGVVSLEAVQDILLQRHLAFSSGRTDLASLLLWTTDVTNLQRLATASPDLRQALPEWLEASAGAAAGAVLACTAHGFGADALAIGLALAVVGATESADDIRLAQAVVRLERCWGGGPIEARVAAAWARAAEEAVIGQWERTGSAWTMSHLRRAEALLGEIGAAEHVHRSRVLPTSLEQRFARLAFEISTTLDHRDRPNMAEVELRLQDVRAHLLSSGSAERLERAEMSLRLLRWLCSGTSASPKSLAQAMRMYADEHAFVDRALASIVGGDPDSEVRRCHERLIEEARSRRGSFDREFAQLLAEWLSTGSTRSEVVPIERLLSEVVAPVARVAPVLFLVLDGLSCAVLQELAEDFAARGWVAAQPAVADGVANVSMTLASVPSVTEWSRASLLSGRRVQGGQNVEKTGFAAHPDLVAASRPKKPPRLFHKAELADGTSADMRDALLAADERVLAIVVNAVDDFLLKSDQVRIRWSSQTIRPLGTILELAATAGRALIVTGDHGHVLEAGTTLQQGSGSDRWRRNDGTATAEEIVLRGPGATISAGDSLIAAWSADVRYGPKKNGYHGGASPAEMVVPVRVFLPPGGTLPGWDEMVVGYPSWWVEQQGGDGAPVIETVPARTRRPKHSNAPQGDLFEAVRQEDATPDAPTWIDALFAAPAYGAQETALARGCPSRAEVRAVLEAATARGGKISRVALAQRLALPAIRLQSRLAALRRLLNIDGYDVLTVDEASDTVELNQQLLLLQFEI